MNRLAAAVFLILPILGFAQEERDRVDSMAIPKSLAGKEAPEIRIAKEHWINAAEAPSLEKYKGRVIWLEFGFLD